MKNKVLPLVFAVIALTVCSCGQGGDIGEIEIAEPAHVQTTDAGITIETAEATAQNTTAPETENKREETSTENEGDAIMQIKIGDTAVSVMWEDNESVKALSELCGSGPLTIHMSMYGGFEQVGPIGKKLPRNDRQTTTQAGDIVLYSGDQIVIFYESNSWSYTRLGRITDKTKDELTKLLGNGDVTITIG